MFTTAQPQSVPASKMMDMRSIPVFLIGYFVVLLGVGLALRETGLFSQVEPIWVGIGAIIAVGAGIMLSVSSSKRRVVEQVQP